MEAMGTLSFTANLRRHVNCPPVTVGAGTVRAALEVAFSANPMLRSYVLDEQGRLRKHVNIYVNDRLIGDRTAQADRIGDSDDVFVFQALSGG
jgi:molybdopterin converting factor small subunit